MEEEKEKRHNEEIASLRKMIWINTAISWNSMILSLSILFGIWFNKSVIIQIVLFLVIATIGFVFWNKWDSIIGKLIKNE